jgi:hypothetical protein
MFVVLVPTSEFDNRIIGPFDDAEAAREKADAVIKHRYSIIEVEDKNAFDPPEPDKG